MKPRVELLLLVLLAGCHTYSADTLVCMGFCAYREHVQQVKDDAKDRAEKPVDAEVETLRGRQRWP